MSIGSRSSSGSSANASTRINSIKRLALVATLTVAGVATVVAAATAAPAGPREVASPAQQASWLNGLNGEHRMLFDSPAPGGGVPLVHIMNYLDTYNSAFKVPDSKVNAIGTFYGTTTFHGLNDAMWTKYGIGDFLAGVGVEKAAIAGNPWRTAPTALGMTLPAASIESLQKRGTKFILCNNALTILSGMLAQSKGMDPKAVYADMKANILPGVEIVPAMVIAIDQAQKAGISYHKQ
jgi:intracellular sulfur oxidation DsrE/DsrF family protein